MRDETLNWFAQHLDQLLNVPRSVNEAALNELPNVQGIAELNMSGVLRTSELLPHLREKIRSLATVESPPRFGSAG